MNELDDAIRNAFEAVQLDSEVQAGLTVPQQGSGWGRVLLAAAALMTVGLVAAPAARMVMDSAGLVREPATRHAIEIEPLDQWLPDGPVEVWSTTACIGIDHGVQRLVRTPEGPHLEVVDPAAWGTGPSGTVRLVGLSGPLRMVAVSPSPMPRPRGSILHAEGASDTVLPAEVLSSTADRDILRLEKSALGEVSMCADADCNLESSLPLDARTWQVMFTELDGLGASRGSELYYDDESGMPLGPYSCSGYTLHAGLRAQCSASGPLPLKDRSVRVVLGEGAEREVVVRTDGDLREGDRVILREGTTVLAESAWVTESTEGGYRVRVPFEQVPALVRAIRVSSEVMQTSATTQISTALLSRDRALVHQRPEAFAVGSEFVGSLGLVVDAKQRGTLWDLELERPSKTRHVHLRLVVREDKGIRVHLASSSTHEPGPVELVAGDRVVEAELLRANPPVAVVRVPEEHLAGLLEHEAKGLPVVIR